MLRRTFLGLTTLLAALSFTQTARAWNATGHMMVAKEAWDEMTPAERQKATAILKNLPHFDYVVSHMPKDYSDPDAYAFMEAATWPDNIRSNDHPDHAEHHPTWHYIDYPVNPDNVPGAEMPNETWDGKSDPENILQALQKETKELSDPDTAPDRRAIALCWVIHLVGDIHQPLHATSLFSKSYPTGDKGGNSFLVKGPFGNTGLHSLWDNMLGVSRNPDAIDKQLAPLEKDPKYSREAMKDQIAKTDPKDWAKESYDLALSVVYQNAHLEGASKELLHEDMKKADLPPLPVGYVEKGVALAQRRIMLAGHRLADLLAKTLPQ